MMRRWNNCLVVFQKGFKVELTDLQRSSAGSEKGKCEGEGRLEGCLETKSWFWRPQSRQGTGFNCSRGRTGWAKAFLGRMDVPGLSVAHPAWSLGRQAQERELFPSRNHRPNYKQQSWRQAGSATVACSGELREPPAWRCSPVLSCRIRKPIITTMCWESSLAARVPRGLAETMWFHFSQWIFISGPRSSLLIVPTFFFFYGKFSVLCLRLFKARLIRGFFFYPCLLPSPSSVVQWHQLLFFCASFGTQVKTATFCL